MNRCVPRWHQCRAIALVLALAASTMALAGCGKLNGMSEPHLDGGKHVSLPAYGSGIDGKPRQLLPDKGKLLLLYFGYLRCPDVCPTTMSALGAAVRSLPAKQQKQLEVAMVTGDPERDSGKDIVRYLRHFFPQLPVYGLRTADMKQLTRVEDSFGAASEIDPHKEGEEYSVSHTAFLYAVDRGGNVLVMWPFGALSEDIAADLKQLLSSQS